MTVEIELTPPEALALAQFAKRSTWSTFADVSTDEVETREMIAAIEALRTALSDAGYNPR
jgi:hypothetical protein